MILNNYLKVKTLKINIELIKYFFILYLIFDEELILNNEINFKKT